MNSNFLSGIKQLLAKHELQAALEQLANFLRGADSNLYNEVLLHTSKLTRLDRQERGGLISPNEAEVQRNRLVDALLQLTDAIPQQLQGSADAPPRLDEPFSVPPSAALEAIFGSNHLKSITWLHRGVEVSRGVCRIVTPQSRGTGFLIKGNRIVTNEHVVPNQGIAAGTWAEFGYEEDLASRLKPSHRYRLKASTYKADSQLDCCAIELEESEEGGPPLSSWSALELATSTQPRSGDHVTIIQHPQGGPKQIALTANQVVNIYKHWLQYTTDTLPGSSGSPVFNDDWKVIALHQGGGELIRNARGDKMFANQGILMSHVATNLGL